VIRFRINTLSPNLVSPTVDACKIDLTSAPIPSERSLALLSGVGPGPWSRRLREPRAGSDANRGCAQIRDQHEATLYLLRHQSLEWARQISRRLTDELRIQLRRARHAARRSLKKEQPVAGSDEERVNWASLASLMRPASSGRQSALLLHRSAHRLVNGWPKTASTNLDGSCPVAWCRSVCFLSRMGCPISLPELACRRSDHRSWGRWFPASCSGHAAWPTQPYPGSSPWPLTGLPTPDSGRSLRQASQWPPTPRPGTRPDFIRAGSYNAAHRPAKKKPA
jgi:hypothetical protein